MVGRVEGGGVAGGWDREVIKCGHPRPHVGTLALALALALTFMQSRMIRIMLQVRAAEMTCRPRPEDSG